MVNDDEMFASFQRCAALGALPLVHCRERRHRRGAPGKIHEPGRHRPRGPRLFAPAGSGRRGDQPRHHDRRCCGRPVYIVHTSSEQAHEAIRRARQKGMRVYGEPLIQHLTLDEGEYFNKELGLRCAARDVAAVPRQDPPGFAVGRSRRGLAAGGGDRPLRLHHQAEAVRHQQLPKIPNGTGGLEDRLSVLWTKGVETGRSRRTSSSR
jgi:dihydropyrimidinase